MPRYPVVLFDMDGVLVDVSGSYRRAIQETAAEYLGRPIPAAEVQRYKNRGGFNDDWRLTEAIVRDAGLTVDFDELVRRFDRRYRGTSWDGYIADEPAIFSSEALDSVARCCRVMGLVTGRPGEEARFTLDRFGWARYFDVLVPMEEQEGRGKPDPFPMQVALERLRSAGHPVAPGETAYVGDSVDDMRSARSAGLRAVGFVPPYLAHSGLERRLFDAGADRVVADPSRVAETIAELLLA